MKHQAEVKSRTPLARIYFDAKEVGNSGLTRFLFLRVLATGIAVWVGSSTLRAEDHLPKSSIGEQQITASYLFDFSQTSLFLQHAPERTGFRIREQVIHLFDTEENYLAYQQEVGQQNLDGDRSFTVFRKCRSSRRSYQAWTDFGAGFGRIFAAETFGRSRTNGVGVEDPDCFYFKMSFKF